MYLYKIGLEKTPDGNRWESAWDWILILIPSLRPYNEWKLECTKPLKGHGDKKNEMGEKYISMLLHLNIAFSCKIIVFPRETLHSFAKPLHFASKHKDSLRNAKVLQANTK